MNFEPGTRLLYGPIGKTIGVSATPVREAVGQLVNEGLIELIPQIGAVVRKIDSSELHEIYEVRLAIEPYAASLAAQRANVNQIASLEAELARMVKLTAQQEASRSPFAGKRITSQFDKADYGFHLAVIDATDNRAMVRTAGQSHVLTRVFGVRRHRHSASSMHDTCAEHEAILIAIRKKASHEASEAAAKHIRHGLELSVRALEAEAHPERPH